MANFYKRLGIPNLGKRSVSSYKDSKFDRPSPSSSDDAVETIPTIPMLLVNGNDTIRLTHRIGKAYGCDKIVYRGVYLVEYDPEFVDGHIPSLRIQDVSNSVVVACEKFKEDVGCRHATMESRKIPHHQNLLRIRESFICNDYYCIVFPFMDMGSFRTIMANRYPRGLPEALILLALSKCLIGLSVIHGFGEVHKNINAGHIFVSARPEIRLAYSASVHDLFTDEDRDSTHHASGFQKAVEICKWAAAPEVYDDDNAYTKIADMWSVGITALELAYGGLRVRNREELMAMVRRINLKKRLPPKGDGSKKGEFSKGFEEMVARCLDPNQANRPTADQLMLSPIFDAADYDLFYSYNLFDPVISDGCVP